MDYLEHFRKEFYSARVSVEDEYMVYTVEPSFGEEASKAAKVLIEELNLPLEVEFNTPSVVSRKETFIIKLKHD